MTPRFAGRRVLISLAVLLAARSPLLEGATVGQWNVDGGGSWGDSGNWLGGLVPGVAGDTAVFGTFLTNPLGAVVTLDGDRTVASLNFNSTAGPYTLTQGTGGTLFMQGSTSGVNSLSINVASGQHVLDVPVVANAALVINATSNAGSPATSLTISGSVSSSSTISFMGRGTSVSKVEITGRLTSNVLNGIKFDSNSGAALQVTVDGGTIGTPLGFADYGLLVGGSNGAVAGLKLNSGTITTSGEFWLGERSTNACYAAFTQTGGVVNSNYFVVVGNSSDRAVFNMKGGVFNFQGQAVTIGAGYSSGNAVGVVNLSGGVFNASNSPIWVGEIGTGVVNVSGSAAVSALYVQFGGSTAILPIRGGDVNLLGGTITTGSFTLFQSGQPTRAVVNFNGGLLKAIASTGSFVGGLNAAYVYAGGAFIDDGGNSVTIQALSAPTGNGVSSVTASGGTGYIDTPLVQFTNAVGDTTGKGAYAVANVDASGNLTGITITNPGVGYTLPPIATLVGGGGSGATIGSVTMAANTSGGLTKLGSGSLTMTGNNTYAGPTNVNAGVLVFNGTLSAGGVNVSGGAGISGGGRVLGPVTLAAGATPATQGTIVSDYATSTLTLSGGLIAGGGVGEYSVLNFELGATSGGYDRVALGSSSLTLNSGGALVRLNTLGALTSGTYTLMTYSNASAPAALALDASQIGLFAATLNTSTTTVSVTIAGQPYPTTAFWTGTYGNAWNVAGGPGSDQSNFNTAVSGGANTLQVPGSITDVYFASTAPVPMNLATILGQNILVKSLTVKAGTGPVSIGGTHTMQIVSGTLVVEAGSGGLSIDCGVSFPAAQSWTNNAGTPLVINGPFTIPSSQNLTTSGNVQLSADWPNFTGTLTVASGVFRLGAGGASGSIGTQEVVYYNSITYPNIVDNGTLVLSRSGDISADGRLRLNISGTRALVLAVDGTIQELLGSKTYSGPTTITAGMVHANNGSFGTNPLVTVNNATLILDGDNNRNIVGTGNVMANSIYGTMTLRGMHAYTGVTTIPISTTAGRDDRIIFSGTNSHSIGIVTGGGTLQVAVNTTLTSDAVTSAAWLVDGVHVVRANGSSTSAVQTLTLAGASNAWTGKVDLTNNGLIVGNGGNVGNQLKQGANLGAWNGTGGITSGAAMVAQTGSTATALGYASGAAFTLGNGQTAFLGQAFLATDTLVMYTLAGDGNLDGGVTFGDFLGLQNHYNLAADWEGGDFNYDGMATFADFLILQNNYNKVLMAGNLVGAGVGAGAVPEPASLGILLAGVGWVLGRRGRVTR